MLFKSWYLNTVQETKTLSKLPVISFSEAPPIFSELLYEHFSPVDGVLLAVIKVTMLQPDKFSKVITQEISKLEAHFPPCVGCVGLQQYFKHSLVFSSPRSFVTDISSKYFPQM